jgi:tetratricopeptide (TPR) repeat protein
LAITALGCASVGGGGDVAESPGVEIRPEAPAEYDVLVAQQHISEGDVEAGIQAYLRAAEKDPDSAYLQRVLADAFARSGDLDASVKHAERAYALEPDDRLGRGLLAQLHRVRREPEKAVAPLIAPSGDPIDIDAAGMLYQIQLESDRPDDALATARWMLENGAEPLQAHIALANVYESLGRYEEQEAEIRKALAIEPDDPRLYGALGRTLRRQGDREGEIALYRDVLKSHPNDRSLLVDLADAQMAEDDLEGAILTLEEVHRRFPDDLRSQMRLAFLYYEARRFEEAVPHFESVLREMPEEHELSFFLGVCLRRADREDDALRVLGAVPPEHKHYAESRTQMASIHEKREDYAAARDAVSDAMKIEPSRPLELYSATLRAKSGDLEGAIAYLESLIEGEPDNDELVYNLGVVYGEGKYRDEAISAMQRALELNPDNASALNYIGYTWAEKGEKLDEAEEMISRAIALRPEDGFIVDSLGWVYYMRALPLVEAGRAEDAKVYIQRALEELERADDLTGGDPVISEHLGDTYLLLDQRQRALEKFREAVELGPRHGEQPDLAEKFENLRREFE